MEQKIVISGETLKLKASEFFKQMSEYKDQKEPAWSNSWLQGFQNKYNISHVKQYRELGSAIELNVDEEIISF
jgi:hypothetical protein